MPVVPYIGATVHFAAPLSGQAIIDLVREFTAPLSAEFVLAQDPAHPDRILVGHSSQHSCDHLRVVDPENTSVGLLPHAPYSRVFVISQTWERQAVQLTGNDVDQLGIVMQFCADLDEAAMRTIGRH